MKAHITNIYGFNNNEEYIQKQHHFAEVGRSMDFREMGIFRYPVDSDTDIELSKRLDGVIASIEHGDVVFVQLPTGNGFKYDNLLVDKIKAYQSKVVLLLHGLNDDNEWVNLYRKANSIIVLGRKEKTKLEYYGFDNVFLLNYKNDFSIKKTYMDLLENVYYVFHREMPELKDEIHVGFGLYDKDGNYSVWVGVAMQSILDHTDSNVCFHILHDETMNEDNRRKLLQVGNTYHSRLLLHEIDSKEFEVYKEQVGHFSIGTLFRIKLPDVVDISKIIYLDADIYVNCDIRELWNIDIGDYCLAAVQDCGVQHGGADVLPVKEKTVLRENYFNAGVLFLNLNNIRKNSNLSNDVINWLALNPTSKLTDQDALNVIFKDSTLLLDKKWNTWVKEINNINENKNVIYHYAGHSNFLYSVSYVDLNWFYTLCKTPWDEKLQLYYVKRDFNRIKDRVDLLEKIISKMNDSTKLVFYGLETYKMKYLYSLFNVKPNKDYRILKVADGDGILECRSLESLKKNNDFIVFVYPETDNNQAINNLENLGLKNEEDFFVVPRLVSYKNGGYIY